MASSQIDSKPADLESAAKRRKLTETNTPLQDLSADVFFDKIDLFSGPMAIVHVDGLDFKLPKNLLGYHSTFFQTALNSGFAESVEQKVSLPECRLDTFKLVIQWIYRGRLVLPVPQPEIKPATPTSGTTVNKSATTISAVQPKESQKPVKTISLREVGASNITKYLDFIECAQYIDLLGPFDPVIADIKTILIQDPDCLESSHIRFATKLLKGHPVRVILAQAATKSYMQMLLDRSYVTFKFNKELDELESFAADMTRESRKSFATMKFTTDYRAPQAMFTLIDPLGNATFNFRPSG